MGSGTNDGEEVAAITVGAAVEVVGRLPGVSAHVGSGVADKNLAVAASFDVGTHVTGRRLDEGGALCGLGLVVDDLVAGEEAHDVGILGKGVDGREYALQVRGVVGLLGVILGDGVGGIVGIEHHIDAGLGEGVHALIVVLGVVGHVDTDDVDTKLLEPLDIRHADLGVGEGVELGGRATGLVIDTTNVEPLLALEEGVAGGCDGLELDRAGLDR